MPPSVIIVSAALTIGDLSEIYVEIKVIERNSSVTTSSMRNWSCYGRSYGVISMNTLRLGRIRHLPCPALHYLPLLTSAIATLHNITITNSNHHDHFGGHMDCVVCILYMEMVRPEELIRKLSTLPAGSASDGGGNAAANDIDAAMKN